MKKWIVLLFGIGSFIGVEAEEIPLWIGTGGGDAEGIYHTVLDTEKGTLRKVSLAAIIGSPGFVTVMAEPPTYQSTRQAPFCFPLNMVEDPSAHSPLRTTAASGNALP